VLLDVLDLAGTADPQEILDLDQAIRRLDELDCRLGQIVRLRFFSGLSVEETAEVLDISARTVRREWNFARAKLFQALGGGERGAE
jgi:RNA polymerase sigma factor (sigma-70 family)